MITTKTNSYLVARKSYEYNDSTYDFSENLVRMDTIFFIKNVTNQELLDKLIELTHTFITTYGISRLTSYDEELPPFDQFSDDDQKSVFNFNLHRLDKWYNATLKQNYDTNIYRKMLIALIKEPEYSPYEFKIINDEDHVFGESSNIAIM